MGENIRVFCAECGTPIDTTTNVEMVTCPACGNEEENPKYNPEAVVPKAEGIIDTAEMKEGVDKLNTFASKIFGTNITPEIIAQRQAQMAKNTQASSPANANYDIVSRGNYDEDKKPMFTREKAFLAYINKSGIFYEGQCPGIDFTEVNMCDSFEDCVSKITRKLKSSVGSFPEDEVQPSIEEIKAAHPGARIIRIKIKY